LACPGLENEIGSDDPIEGTSKHGKAIKGKEI
jgi:hypothetical protein